MKTTPKAVKAILDTLPIGYYAGMRVPVVLDETSATSFVSLTEKVIHVAFRNVESAMEEAPEGTETEGTIRALLYHELLHVMLTPSKLEMQRHRNVLEDERIETMGRKTFHGVDFRENVKRINHYQKGKEPENALQLLFRVARYREGPKELLEELRQLLRDHCNPKEDEYTLGYAYDVFWSHVKAAWNDMEEEKAKKSAESENQGEGNGEEENAGTPEEESREDGEGEENGEEESREESEEGETESAPETAEDGEEKESREENAPEEGESSGDGEEGKEEPEGREGEEESTDEKTEGEAAGTEEGEDDTETALDPMGWGSVKEGFKKRLESVSDPKTAAEVRRIVIKATRKRGVHGGARHGYAGRINPYSIATRRDYKWFDKKGESGTGFEKIHLRLWVDVSESFDLSIGKVNALLAALLEAEREMPEWFAVSVIAMGSWNRVHDKAKELVAKEGNYFGAGVTAAARATEKAGWKTVDVAVWDGILTVSNEIEAAYSEFQNYLRRNYRRLARAGKMKEDMDAKMLDKLRGPMEKEVDRWREAYEVLNRKGTIIVADRMNMPILDYGCPKAKRTYLSRNYAEEFVSVVLKELDRAL